MYSSIHSVFRWSENFNNRSPFKMMQKSEFAEGDAVVASEKTLSSPKMAAQLMRRTCLTAEELKSGQMKIIATRDGQAEISHDRLEKPFVVHTKFLARASAA